MKKRTVLIGLALTVLLSSMAGAAPPPYPGLERAPSQSTVVTSTR